MSPALTRLLESLAVEVGAELVHALFDAVASGEPDRAEREARLIAETVAAKRAVRAARERGGVK